MYFFHQLVAINIIKPESCTLIIHCHICIVMHACRKQSNNIIKPESCTSIHSHTCIVMHARRKQSNWNKTLISLHMNIMSQYFYTNFVCARSTHIFCASLKINNHFDLILMSFLSPSPTYNKCSTQNKLILMSFFLLALH